MGQCWHSYILYGEDGKIIRSFGSMKLSKYIRDKLHETWPRDGIPDEDIVEEWIVEWYRGEFKEVGCDGSVAKPRMPPSWLAQWSRNEKV
tara:strand:- start:236 stop:505 length:270 start_codon:yes stop_codon:yes gene_type:complete